MALTREKKPPAFQFYPKDWDSDEHVIPMTYEEEGIYFALCRRYWVAGNTLPADLDELRTLLKGRPSRRKMEGWWRTIGKCFGVSGDVLTHKKLDEIRQEQRDRVLAKSCAAKERWRKAPKNPNETAESGMQRMPSASANEPARIVSASANGCPSSASSSASSSAEREAAARAELWPQRPLVGRRDLSAFWEGPSFSVPQRWAEKAIQASNGRITEADLTAFARELHARVERDRLDLTQFPNRLAWLDKELAAWTGRRRDTAGADALEARTNAHLQMVQGLTGGRG